MYENVYISSAGKVGENGQNSGTECKITLDKTVGLAV
jgi:hypothetical protein